MTTAEQPTAKQPATKQPTAKSPTAKSPTAKSPITKTPDTKVPDTRAPAAQQSVEKAPSTEPPSGEEAQTLVFSTPEGFQGPELQLISAPHNGGTYYWLKQQRNDPGVVILPWDGQHFGLIKQFRVATGRSHWQAPRGYAETTDARPEESAKRELEEETGLVTNELKRLGHLYADPGILSNSINVFLAEVTPADLAQACTPNPGTDQDESIEVLQAFTSEELDELIRTGELDDGLTLAALALFRTQIEQ